MKIKSQKQIKQIVGILVFSSTIPVMGQVHWRNEASLQSTAGSTSPETIIQSSMDKSEGQATHFLVRFDSPVTSEHRAALGQAGLILGGYLGNNAYFAHVSPNGVPQRILDASSSLVEAQSVQKAWKLHPVLAEGDRPDWAQVPGPDGAAERGEPWIAGYVLIHKDVEIEKAREQIKAAGASVKRTMETVHGFVVEFPFAKVETIAEIDAVMYLEPALPPLGEVNAENRALTGADIVHAPPYKLDGSGVTVMVYDGGTVSETHADFGGRVTNMDGANAGAHATHVGGTIGGDGTASGGLHKGMAPGATLLSYSMEGELAQGFIFYTDPGDLEEDFADAIANGAEVGNASLALNLSINGGLLDCGLMGDYSVVSGMIDGIVRGSLGTPFRSIWGAGNERTYPACGDTYATIPPPHAAKNHIAVGAVNANDDSMADFSSWGPVDDGRIKPDIVAPGCQVGGDNGVTSTSAYDDTGYLEFCGTSMASPTVTGLSALLIQDYKMQFPGRPLFRNSMLKAWLCHTAVDLGNVGPDYQFGYGSVRIQPAIDLMRTGAFREDSLSHGHSYVNTISVDAGDPELKVTLAWDDYPALPNVIPSLVNDLDLVVTSPSGVRHYPWTLDPANPSLPAIQTQEDHVNVIEQVTVEYPEAGEWTIEVVGVNVPEGPQPFSLIGDGAVQAGLMIDLPAGAPEAVAPGERVAITAQILADGESILPGSPTLHYRLDGGSWQSASLDSVGENLYEVFLPAATCSDSPEFYLSAEGTVTGLVRYPADAPADVFRPEVGVMNVIFEDDFETDQGWIASDNGATAGYWDRGVPVPNPIWGARPETDADGSGSCYVTDNRTGLNDVDGGSVILTSPSLDMAGYASEFTFAYYLYTNDYSNHEDVFTVEVSINGDAGPWVEVYRWDLPTDPVWYWGTITSQQLSTFGIVPSSDTHIRFLATDDGAMSTVEGGLDAISVSVFTCEDVAASCDDGILNQGETRIDCGGPCSACDCIHDGDCETTSFCDGIEECNDYGQCIAGDWPCDAGQWCNESAMSCVDHGDGDFDGDLDVDLADFQQFQICYDSSAELNPDCASGNLFGVDGVIDLDDYERFSSELNVSGVE